MVGINPERLTQHTIEQNSNSNGDLQQMLADRDMLKALMKSDGDEDLIARRNSIPHPTDPRDRKDLPQVHTSDRMERDMFPNKPQQTIQSMVKRDLNLEECPATFGAIVIGSFAAGTPTHAVIADVKSMMLESRIKWDEDRAKHGLDFPEDHLYNPTKVHPHPLTGAFSVVIWAIIPCSCPAPCRCLNTTNPLDVKISMHGVVQPHRPTSCSSQFYSLKGALRASDSKGGSPYARPYMLSMVNTHNQLPEHSDNILLVVGGMGRHPVINYAIIMDTVTELCARSTGALSPEDIKVTIEVH